MAAPNELGCSIRIRLSKFLNQMIRNIKKGHNSYGTHYQVYLQDDAGRRRVFSPSATWAKVILLVTETPTHTRTKCAIRAFENMVEADFERGSK